MTVSDMTIDDLDHYRAQITRCAQSLAVARNEKVVGDLDDTDVSRVSIFTDGNLDKRRQKIADQLDLLAAAIPDVEQYVDEYVYALPLVAYDTGSSDTERFLTWLVVKNRTLTPEQLDYVTCQRARHRVEAVGRKNRRGHVRFQGLWRSADRLASNLGTDDRLRVWVNPIRVWTQFRTTVLLEDNADVPTDVVFFAAGSDIRTAALDARGIAMLREMETITPCTVDRLIAHGVTNDKEELVEFCRDCAEMGLMTFG